jgi:ethanolamine ammonia-lyase small subunit
MAFDLKQFTKARVGMGERVSTGERLRFDLDHARARDAVHMDLDASSLGFDHLLVESEVRDRRSYLLRPDLGRRLGQSVPRQECDAVIIVADGLSALAVHRHAAAMVERLKELLADWKLGPIVVAKQARVAIGDAIGEQMGAKMSLVLIGERPGLSSPDSLGAYLTYEPRQGKTDADRNCVSNIRPEGLSYDAAAGLLVFLMNQARLRQVSGVTLKGDATPYALADSGADSAD